MRVPDSGDDVDIHAVLAAQQAAVAARLEEGLQDIQRRADQLMRRVGAEVFRAMQQGGGAPLKDDAARSILTYVDERFQTLNMAVGRLEQAVQKLAQATGDVLLRTDKSREAVDRVAIAAAEQSRRTQQGMTQLATRVERSIQPVAARLDAVEAAVKAATARQRADLAAFTERTSEGLVRVGQRLREGFAAVAKRSDERTRAVGEEIAASVRAEIERLEEALAEQAERSATAAERVALAAQESTARVERALESLGQRLDARLEDAVTETEALVNEAVTRMARRQTKLLEDAIAEVQDRRPPEAPVPLHPVAAEPPGAPSEEEPPPVAVGIGPEPVFEEPEPEPDPESEAHGDEVQETVAPIDGELDHDLDQLRSVLAELADFDGPLSD
ncbi:MAG TPA: hypothetical protein VM638_02935 [Actinomycetota bacterium]|nr:hypothetical protein [Actinomycetota bacterium]